MKNSGEYLRTNPSLLFVDGDGQGRKIQNLKLYLMSVVGILHEVAVFIITSSFPVCVCLSTHQKLELLILPLNLVWIDLPQLMESSRHAVPALGLP